MGHSKLYLLDEINNNYVLAGMPAYYSWRTAPEPDDGRRYFGDYDKQQNPSLYAGVVANKTVAPPPPPYCNKILSARPSTLPLLPHDAASDTLALALDVRAPAPDTHAPAQSRALIQAAPSFYRETTDGNKIALPSESDILKRDLNHKPFPCPCARVYTEKTQSWSRPRTHTRKDCLRGIAIALQKSKKSQTVKGRKI